MTDAKELGSFDVLIACALVLIAGIVSFCFRLKLEKKLFIAALRTVAQLIAVGYVLRWIFSLHSLPSLLPIIGLMFVNAALVTVQRPERTFRGISIFAFLSLIATGSIIVIVITALIVQAKPWYNPQYLIPLLGMILGNTLTALSLCIDAVLSALSEHREEVEMELAHGATSWEAARPALVTGVSKGMIPMINAMMAVGIVSLPGMMTGQILQGADPLNAVKYQIVVMFMLAASSALSSTAMALFIYKRMFSREHRLNSALIIHK